MTPRNGATFLTVGCSLATRVPLRGPGRPRPTKYYLFHRTKHTHFGAECKALQVLFFVSFSGYSYSAGLHILPHKIQKNAIVSPFCRSLLGIRAIQVPTYCSNLVQPSWLHTASVEQLRLAPTLFQCSPQALHSHSGRTSAIACFTFRY